MKPLMTPKELAERYRCSEKTARRYMKQMEHMEKPLRVTTDAVEQWELDRTMGMGYDLPPVRRPRPKPGAIYISRTREART